MPNFVLVFLGVTIALWFENVNDARREYHKETRVLRELADALTADVRDIGANLREDSLTLMSIDVVLGHMEQSLPYSDTLADHFAQAAGLTIFIDNSARTSTSKSQGPTSFRTTASGSRLSTITSDWFKALGSGRPGSPSPSGRST